MSLQAFESSYDGYRKYKAGTEEFLIWLLEAGLRCGFKPTATADASTARRADPKDILPIARKIVQSKSTTVPIPVLKASFDAIEGREQFAAHFKESTDRSDTVKLKKNQRHTDFTGRLRHAIIILQPCLPMMNQRSTSGEDSETTWYSFEALKKQFAALEVGESQEIGLKEMEAGDDAPPAQAELPYELRSSDSEDGLYSSDTEEGTEEGTEEEKLVAVQCLFRDFNQLRGYLKKLWNRYESKSLDLIPASVATNTAIQLAIRIENDLVASFPELAGYQEVLTTLRNEDKSELQKIQTLTLVYEILNNFCKAPNPRLTPYSERAHNGEDDYLTNRSSTNCNERFKKDYTILMDILPEFSLPTQHKIDMFAEDQISRGLRQMFKTRKFPIWLVFAVAVFLDIHDILGDAVDSGLKILDHIAQDCKEALDRYFKPSEDIVRTHANEDNIHSLRRACREQVSPNRTRDQEPASTSAVNDNPDVHEQALQSTAKDCFYLYRRHPVLCGILAFSTLLERQRLGIDRLNGMGTIILNAYLYTALRVKSNPVAPWKTALGMKSSPFAPWRMMDNFIKVYGEDRIFVGSRPTGVSDCYKQFKLTTGFSAEKSSVNCEKCMKKASKKSNRRVRANTPISNIFYQDFRTNRNKATKAIPKKVVEALNNRLSGDSAGGEVRLDIAATERLNLTRLLHTLIISIEEELPKLSFDYFEMHRQNSGLQKRLKLEMDDGDKKLIGLEDPSKHCDVIFVGTLLSKITAKSQSHTALSKPVSESVCKLLDKTEGVFDAYVRELEARSSLFSKLLQYLAGFHKRIWPHYVGPDS
ncbi:hypothetical protein EG329_011693 [Mollisiaceae sp. DMI_Dod_QoI]|nr:hypothetical protein EG329_011693 [Helotiales sp. DMI_Dod_QoI]